jgi:hypothetical protein
MPETISILQSLSQPSPGIPNPFPQITEDNFISAYKVTPKAASTSPSGRQVGLVLPHLLYLVSALFGMLYNTISKRSMVHQK